MGLICRPVVQCILVGASHTAASLAEEAAEDLGGFLTSNSGESSDRNDQ